MQICLTGVLAAQGNYEFSQGTVNFKSNAPQENIEAQTNAIIGVMNITSNKFAFSVDINSFKGFNSALQQEHFYENYLETDLYPRATFSGKLIDNFDPTASTQKLRTKGKLDIHGVVVERIIEVTIKNNNGKFEIESDFNVLLNDHAIKIPKVVFQKIAENINVNVKGELVQK